MREWFIYASMLRERHVDDDGERIISDEERRGCEMRDDETFTRERWLLIAMAPVTMRVTLLIYAERYEKRHLPRHDAACLMALLIASELLLR